jgi:hypothetical protein
MTGETQGTIFIGGTSQGFNINFYGGNGAYNGVQIGTSW